MSKNIAIIGGGWAGMAAAVYATQNGHHATVFESTRQVGGRARLVNDVLPNGTPVVLDNGQHILIGAYSETLKLMQTVGVDLSNALLRLPMSMQFADGTGLQLPDWRQPWVVGLDAVWGIAQAKGWSWTDKIALLRAAAHWQRNHFSCHASDSVLRLCQKSTPPITPTIMTDLIEPLCLSALNTPVNDASGQVFLRVLQDAMFSNSTVIDAKTSFGSANMLLPRRDLSSLFPHPAAAWLVKRGGKVITGERINHISFNRTGWQVHATTLAPTYDAVILAGNPSNMAKITIINGHSAINNRAIELYHLLQREWQTWTSQVNALHYEAITTVYAYAKDAKLARPMLALKSNTQMPAQFVFDRGQLGSEPGLLAFVISASQGDRLALQKKIIEQAASQLNLPNLQTIQTIVEKRATFACTTGLQRPSCQIAPGLMACGDYINGPYPATLEGAVRSAQQAVSWA